MHYTQQDIQDRATDAGNGWTKAVIELGKDDTAHSAVSTKWDFAGPGTVAYMIHPSGWDVRPSVTITRTYSREGN